MPRNEVSKDIKEAKFISALVDSNGIAKEAYKAVSSDITEGSAKTGGSRMLSSLNQDDTKTLLNNIGCTKEAVLSGIWQRMEKSKKLGEYVRGADVICKIGGFYTPKTDSLREIMENGLDLVEIIKVRLKPKKDKELQQNKTAPIDVSSTPTDDLDKKT